MNKEELHSFIENQQPNICQIVAIKDNKIVYSDNWNNYKKSNYYVGDLEWQDAINTVIDILKNEVGYLGILA